MTDRPVPDHPRFALQVTGAGDRAVVTVAGEIDLATADEFAGALRRHLAEQPVLLDLADVTFMDSSGVRVLDDLLREIESDDWTLAIRPAMHGNVRQVLEVTGMLAVLPFEGEEER